MVGIAVGVISKTKKYGISEIFFSLLATLVFVYLYSFCGAYYISLVKVYSNIINKWIIYLECISVILIFMKYSQAEARNVGVEMNKSFDNKEFEDAFLSSIAVVGLSLNWVLLLSFIFFAFFPNSRNFLFFNVPDLMANLFR